jgi:hypothetical protein
MKTGYNRGCIQTQAIFACTNRAEATVGPSNRDGMRR